MHFVIKQHKRAVYILYALQLKFEFLKKRKVTEKLKSGLKKLRHDEFKDQQERTALYLIIKYLSEKWKKELNRSKQIYDYNSENKNVKLFNKIQEMDLDGLKRWARDDNNNDGVVSLIKEVILKKFL